MASFIIKIMSGIQNVLEATGNCFSIWPEIQTRGNFSSLHPLPLIFVQEHVEWVKVENFQPFRTFFQGWPFSWTRSFTLGQLSHHSQPIVALIGHSLMDLTQKIHKNTHLPDHGGVIEFLLKIPESILCDNLV